MNISIKYQWSAMMLHQTARMYKKTVLEKYFLLTTTSSTIATNVRKKKKNVVPQSYTETLSYAPSHHGDLFTRKKKKL
jgi:hypothetical protein